MSRQNKGLIKDVVSRETDGTSRSKRDINLESEERIAGLEISHESENIVFFETKLCGQDGSKKMKSICSRG